MTLLEITLLLGGVLVFIASFIVPEKQRKLSGQTKESLEQEIQDLIAKALENMPNQLEESMEEPVSIMMEKIECSLDRLTNEKIMAVNEYSDTVLEEINKNHNEVMFLYDMLSDKQNDLQNLVRRSEAACTELKKAMVQLQNMLEPLEKEEEAVTAARTQKPAKQTSNIDTQKKNKVQEVPMKSMQELQMVSQTQAAHEREEMEMPDIQNNKEKILAMHKEGKSNMMIARELNLGVGEVKLVIDLFKGSLT